MKKDRSANANNKEMELLTGLLQPYFPPEKCAVVAKNLISKFGSAYRALLASEQELKRVEGMTKAAAFYLPMQYRMFLRIRSEQRVVSGDSLYRFSQIAVNLAGGRSTEAVYLALLDKSNRLCGCFLISSGESMHVDVDMRKVYRTLTDYPDTESVIFIHNHPSGVATPSLDDIKTTEWAGTQLKAIGIKIKDHIVVGNGQAFSFSESGLQQNQNVSWKDEMVIGPDGMPYFPEEVDDL